jgi:hypothetical protein
MLFTQWASTLWVTINFFVNFILPYLGVDELLIAFEKKPTDQEEYLPGNLIRSLMRYSEICLSPTTNSLDDRNGIRQCANRMSPLFEIDPDESEGHNAVAIYFHPYQGQVS